MFAVGTRTNIAEINKKFSTRDELHDYIADKADGSEDNIFYIKGIGDIELILEPKTGSTLCIIGVDATISLGDLLDRIEVLGFKTNDLYMGDLVRVYNDFDKRVTFDTISRVTNTEAITTDYYYKLDLRSDKVKSTCLTYRKATEQETQEYINVLKGYPIITEYNIANAIDRLIYQDKNDLCEDGREFYYIVDSFVEDYFKKNNLDYNKPFIIKNGNSDYKIVRYRDDLYDHTMDNLSTEFMNNHIIGN